MRDIVNKNLCINGDFENAPSGTTATTTAARWIDNTAGGTTDYNSGYKWYFIKSGTATALFDSSVKFNGSFSLKASTTAVSSYIEISNGGLSYTPRYSEVPSGIKLKTSTSYTLTYWMKINVNSGTSNNGATIFVCRSDGAGGNSATDDATYIKTTTDWTRYEYKFTTNAYQTIGVIQFRLYGHTGTGTLIADVWIDDVVLKPTTPVTRSSA